MDIGELLSEKKFSNEIEQCYWEGIYVLQSIQSSSQ